MPDNEGVYAIAQWERFENCRTREVKYMSWISLPVAFDSDSIGFLMSKPNGLRNFGLFVGLIQIAANMPVRGVLKDSKGPLTPKRLAMMLRCSEAEVAEGLAVLSDPDVGLISRSCTTSHDIAQIPCLSVVSVCPVLSVSKTPEIGKPKSSDKFTADRQLRTKSEPPGFTAFMAAYPDGNKRDPAGLLAYWNANGCEDDAQRIMAGLEAWKACERWAVKKCVLQARRFLEEQTWLQNPPESASSAGIKNPPVVRASTDQAAAAAWFLTLTPEQKTALVYGQETMLTSMAERGTATPQLVSIHKAALAKEAV